MRLSIYWRLLSSFLAVLLSALLPLSIILNVLFVQILEDQTETILCDEAKSLARKLSLDIMAGEELESTLKKRIAESQKSDVCIWATDAEGNWLIGDPLSELTLEEQWFIESALQGKTETSYEYFKDAFHQSVVSVGVPIWLEGKIIGALVTHTVRPTMSEAIWSVTKQIAPWTVFCLILGIMLAGMNAQSIGKPVMQINAAAREYAGGNLRRRVDTSQIRGGEMQKLATTFNTMADSLERQSKARTEFVANASHELRSPLTNMHGYLQAMLDGTIPPDEYRQYMEVVDAETVRLSELVNDLLNLSKIDSGTQVPLCSVFDINELLRRKLVQFATRIEEKGINVQLDIDSDECLVYADRERIGLVLQNLLDNAIKFTPCAGMIRLVSKPRDGSAEIEVANTGPGIPKEDLPYIFDRFYMADKGRKPGSGTGLGLALVDEILKQHGCKIECRSKPCRETVFSFALCIAEKNDETNEEVSHG